MSDGSLAGLRVIDVSTILAGPLCCQILGDYGAEVIKIEHPERGDGMRGHGPAKDGVPLWWKEISRNKRTVGLSLSDPDGAEVFLRLVETADVLVENFRPGHPGALGPRPRGAARERNPGLVIVRVTGFGQTGPYAARAGFGTLAEAMSGFAHLTGEADGPPTLPAFGLADSICGIAASSAVMMALWHRDRNGGRGQVIDINLLEPIMTAVGPVPTDLRPARRRRGAARQPVDEQRAAQHLPHRRRQLGRGVDQRAGDRRAGHAPRRPPRGHRRAVVRHRAAAGRARRPAGRVRRRLDRRPDPRRGARRVRRGRRRGRAGLQRGGPRRGRARARDRRC